MNNLKQYAVDNMTHVKWFMLIMFLHVIQFAHGVTISHSIDFNIDSVKVESIEAPNGLYYSRLKLKQMYFHGIPGSPELPIKYIRLQVPMGACNLNASIADTRKKMVRKLEYMIYPIQEEIAIANYSQNLFTNPNIEAYGKTPNIPVVRIVDTNIIDGIYNVVTISLNPVVYDFTSGYLSFYDNITIMISYDIDDSANQADFSGQPIIDINPIIDNKSELSSHNKILKKLTEEIESKLYLIVSEKKFFPQLEELAIWKRQKGYNVELIAIEDIYSSSKYKVAANKEIVDNAASLRMFLKDRYSINNDRSFFCLLVGDGKTKMPIRKVYSKEYSQGTPEKYYSNPNGECYIPTDSYFSDLNTKWNLKLDKSGIYTQDVFPSYTPNIYIGRLLCHTNSGIASYIKKLIKYEACPGNGDMTYLNEAKYFVQYDGRTIYKECVDKICNYFDVKTFLDIAIADNTKYGGSPTGEFVISELSKSGFVSMMGHGEPSSIACSGRMKHSDVWEYISALDYYKSDIDENNNVTTHGQSTIRKDCKNNGLELLDNFDCPGVLYSLGCNTSPFDTYETSLGLIYDIPETVASSFTTGGKYGGVAFLGNTRQGYWGSSSELESIFLSSIVNYRKIGIAEGISKYLFNSLSKVKHEHHLIGDPEFEMWLGLPKKLDVQIDWKSNGALISGKDLKGSKIILYNGSDSKVFDCAEDSYSISYDGIGTYNGIKLISIWKTDYLPIWGLQGNGQSIDDKMSFVVVDAALGNDNMQSDYIVGNNANLNIRAVKSIKCGSNFKIYDGGETSLYCDNSIIIDGSKISQGGHLNVKTETVVFGSGFHVEKGGVLIVE